MNKPIDKLTTEIIIGLKLTNLSNSDTIQILSDNSLKINRQSIDRIWKEWSDTGEIKPKFEGQSGSKQKFNQESIDALNNYVKLIQKQAKETSRNLKQPILKINQAILFFQLFTSKRNFLKKQIKVIKITPESKQKRVTWSKNLLRTSRKEIKNCFYSNETWVQFQSDYSQWVWVGQDDELDIKLETSKYPKKLMIRGAIHMTGALSIKFIEGYINKEKYHEILSEFFDEIQQSALEYSCFQQGNA